MYDTDRVKSLKNGEYEYRESDKLGEGSFAIVYKGVITKNSRVIAVRLLPLTLVKQYGNKIKEIISGEVGVLKDLSMSDNTNALFTTKIYDCFMTENNVVMILEFCPDGNLEDIVKKGPLHENQALEVLYQLALGLEFIAKEKVVHRDIKPDNVFVRKAGPHTLYKLGDFGFAVKKQLNQQIVGTPIFMSPELFREEKYGSEVDVWAFGLMAHYILFKEYFFLGATEQQIKNRVLKEKYALKSYHKEKVSKEMADFLTQCLQMDKKDRMKAINISSHPVFNPIRPKIHNMINEVLTNESMIESQISRTTPKGQLTLYFMKYNFLIEFAGRLAKLDHFNLASLYIYKHALGDLEEIRDKMNSKVNIVGHVQWNNFCNSPEYEKSYKVLKTIMNACEKQFQKSFDNIIPVIKNNYGPQVAQGIQQNLGNGPYAKIDPKIVCYELTNTWYPRLQQNKTPETHFVALQLVLVLGIYQEKKIDFDFTAWYMQKDQLSLEQASSYFESNLKSSFIS